MVKDIMNMMSSFFHNVRNAAKLKKNPNIQITFGYSSLHPTPVHFFMKPMIIKYLKKIMVFHFLFSIQNGPGPTHPPTHFQMLFVCLELF